MGELDGNSGTGNGLNGVRFGGDTLAVNSDWSWSGTCPGPRRRLRLADHPPGVTLTLGAGTLVKAQQTAAAKSSSRAPSKPTAPAPARSPSPPGATTRSAATPTATPAPPRRWPAATWAASTPAPPATATPTRPSTLTTSSSALRLQPGAGQLGHHLDHQLDGPKRPRATASLCQLPGRHPRRSPGNTVTKVASNAISIPERLTRHGALDRQTPRARPTASTGCGWARDTLAVSSSLPWSGNLARRCSQAAAPR